MTAEIQDCLLYNPETGIFTWKIKKSNAIKVGSVAGSYNKKGYLVIGLNSKILMGSHLAWYLYYNKWPTNCIDHIDGNPSNNRITNLRECSKAENNRNRNAVKNSTSHYKGVYWHKTRNRWKSAITFEGKRLHMGDFKCEKEAALAYNIKAEQLYKQFAKLNEVF